MNSYAFSKLFKSAYPHRASLKNMPGHGGIRTYDLWNTSPMLFQLSYAVRTVRVSDISEQYLVPSIPMCSSNMNFFLAIEHWASIPKVVGSNPTVAGHIFQARPVWICTQSNIANIFKSTWQKRSPLEVTTLNC